MSAEQTNLKLLVIDDDTQILALLRAALEQPALEILTEENPEKGFEMFVHLRPRIVLLDLVMPNVDGISLLERMVAMDPGADVVLMTAHYTPESAVEAIQKGAADYLTKPLDIAKIRSKIGGLIAEAEQRRRTLCIDRQILGEYQFEGMIGRSPLMLEVFSTIRRVAPHFRTVMITGPTGTGKELVAHALHRQSRVASAPFVVCNCSALVETLIESELFGYSRGAFTGAAHDKPGLFEHADGGVLFLDEVGELSLAAQAKLLRVLQNRKVQRIGSLTPRAVDVRVVAATHRNLQMMVREKTFREDLYYRLSVVDIRLPSLAQRSEDLPLLQRHFIEKFAAEYQKPIFGITRRAQTRMAAYQWPGNVRELENAIGSACIMTSGTVIDLTDLPDPLRASSFPTHATDTPLNMEEMQMRYVLRVLEAVGGNKARAAQILGIGRATLYEVLAKVKTGSYAGSHLQL